MDAKLLEMWLRLTADAVRGADDARRAMEALSQGPPSAEAFARWAEVWLPPGSMPTGGEGAPAGEELREVAEQWWKAVGVVPLYRYTELLQHYEEVKAKLEEAERTVRALRELVREEGREAEAVAALEAWERMTKETLKMQEEWARLWTDPRRPKK
jgi:hypothetical protein